ncbi:GvpL/GvpF family gas vesicle protein [Streptomyces sp. RFCAC02]|uniref:GvpL/GvpF family gas vesicle protein n=1 Tax=Streptomyces sp. RFCAC02 TaxID=2499143 RepID=UPI001F10B8E4|nr:GvpL/GvpF family gas vesicle protein [Streptomyces sp. RFCAC02]
MTTPDDTASLRYVYAVVRADVPPPPDTLHGIGDRPPRACADGGLAAVVGDVPAADFAEEPLRAHLEDLAWLEGVARAHQGVVDALAGTAGCVLPLRLATVCRDEDGVRRLLAENRERFTTALERLDGRAEWGVKLYADLPAAQGDVPPPPAGGGTARSGRDYLRQRRRSRDLAGDAWRRAEAAARLVHGTLTGVAEHARLHQPQDARLTGERGTNLLNGAYLVPHEAESEFRALVGRLAAQVDGLRLSLTGPWVPYSFTATVAGGPAGAGA